MNVLLKIDLAVSLFIWGGSIISQAILFAIYGKPKIYTTILKHWTTILPITMGVLTFLVIYDLLIAYLATDVSSTFVLLKAVYTVASIIFLIQLANKKYAVLLEFRFASGALHLLALNAMLILLQSHIFIDIMISVTINVIPYIFFEIALIDPPAVLIQEIREFRKVTQKEQNNILPQE